MHGFLALISPLRLLGVTPGQTSLSPRVMVGDITQRSRVSTEWDRWTWRGGSDRLLVGVGVGWPIEGASWRKGGLNDLGVSRAAGASGGEDMVDGGFGAKGQLL